jgi:hypothetical protein
MPVILSSDCLEARGCGPAMRASGISFPERGPSRSSGGTRWWICQAPSSQECRKRSCTCISNSYVTDGLKAPEIKSLLDAGVRATVNSDDPAYFPGYINENLIAVQRAVQLTRDEILQLTRNAFTVSWLSPTDRDRYLDALEAYAATAD